LCRCARGLDAALVRRARKFTAAGCVFDFPFSGAFSTSGSGFAAAQHFTLGNLDLGGAVVAAQVSVRLGLGACNRWLIRYACGRGQALTRGGIGTRARGRLPHDVRDVTGRFLGVCHRLLAPQLAESFLLGLPSRPAPQHKPRQEGQEQ
jgi:hypothetical protein